MLDILEQKCRVCGCTEMQACPGGCHWVTPDLCSACQVDEGDAALFTSGNGGVMRIAQERLRQIAEERHSPEHDQRYVDEELACAAAVFVLLSDPEHPVNGPLGVIGGDHVEIFNLWPWPMESLKPKSRLENLTRAGALIAAEIDRILAQEGLVLFDPSRMPERDDEGMCCHPDLRSERWNLGNSDEIYDPMHFARAGFETKSIEFEHDAPDDLHKAWHDDGEAYASRWTPSVPSGDGWMLAGIWDAEDGPLAFYVRPVEGDAKAALIAELFHERRKAEQLRHRRSSN